MIDKETLSRISEYPSGAKLARPGSTAAASAPSHEASADKALAARPTETRAIGARALEKALGNLSAHVQNLQRSLHFTVDEESGETIVRVVDSETDEVIRQIPSEELLTIAERLRSSAGALLSDQV